MRFPYRRKCWICQTLGVFKVNCYSPCECSNVGCYSCAIDYIIAQVHGFGGCTCIATGKPFSRNCAKGTSEDFKEAFRRADAPYLGLAKARAVSRGIVGAPDGLSIWAKQDLDRAAEILNAEAAQDSVSFDAALWFVSERVRQGRVVPEVLRAVWTCRVFVPPPSARLGHLPFESHGTFPSNGRCCVSHA